MQKFIVTGEKQLRGEISVSGAKNAALKALVAACLTDEEVIIKNIPLISDFFCMVDIMKYLGAKVSIRDHTVKIKMKKFVHHSIPLDKAALARASVMFIAPLLARTGEAIIPNPGGCRLGARPINRTVDGISKMNVEITYNREDGYFHAVAHGDNLGIRPIDRTLKGLKKMGTTIDYDESTRHYYAKSGKNGEETFLQAIEYTFEKNTHTGTETMILAAVLANGTTILRNAAEEPEIDDLIGLLCAMGASITRSGKRQITIKGVKKLHKATFTISPDRNEIVTFAIAALVTKGDILIKGAATVDLAEFLEKLNQTGAHYSKIGNDIRFYTNGPLKAVDVITSIYPGFMTDWQAPWGVLMTQAQGSCIIHETVFEDKLGYINDLKKMGAKVTLFNPKVKNPEKMYNFNLDDDKPQYFHAVTISGPSQLHDAIVSMRDLRAGAAIVLAALVAKGTSTIFGIEKLDRGYEKFEDRLRHLGANIKRINK